MNRRFSLPVGSGLLQSGGAPQGRWALRRDAEQQAGIAGDGEPAGDALGLLADVVSSSLLHAPWRTSNPRRTCPQKSSACRRDEIPCASFSAGAACTDSPRPLLRPGSARAASCAASTLNSPACACPVVEPMATSSQSCRHALPLPGSRRSPKTTTVGLTRPSERRAGDARRPL